MKQFLLGDFIEINESLKQVKEKIQMYQFLLDNFDEMTEFQFNEINDIMEGLYTDIYYYEAELLKYFGKGENQMEKLEIMQWGLKRSIVFCVNIETGKSTILLMDNDYLMFLDELGLI